MNPYARQIGRGYGTWDDRIPILSILYGRSWTCLPLARTPTSRVSAIFIILSLSPHIPPHSAQN